LLKLLHEEERVVNLPQQAVRDGAASGGTIRGGDNGSSSGHSKCMLILFLISHPVILSFGMLSQMVICIVLIVVIFLGLINHIME
jgi:hypothetical protein